MRDRGVLRDVQRERGIVHTHVIGDKVVRLEDGQVIDLHVSAVVDRGHSGDVQVYDLTILRSEEHTSELQSRFDLVCRLLLEKKKNKKTTNIYLVGSHHI